MVPSIPADESRSLTAFDKWVDGIMPEVQSALDALRNELSDNPTELSSQLKTAEGYFSRMVYFLAWANSFLDAARRQSLLSREEGWTDLDRKIRMDDAVKDEVRVRAILDGLCKSIQNRLILGMALLKSDAGERLRAQ